MDRRARTPLSVRLSLLLAGCLLGIAAPAHAASPGEAIHAEPVTHVGAVPVPAAHAAVVAQVHEPAPSSGPKVVSVQEAAKLAGHRIFFGTLASTPEDLAKEIRQQAVTGDKKIEGFYMGTTLSAEHFSREVSEKLHPNLFFVSAGNRDAASDGSATRIHDNLFNLSKRIKSGEFGLDTVVVRVSPPNKDGMVSLGPAGDLTMHAVEQVLALGGKVIAQVNPNVPFTRGTNTIPYSKLAAVVESNEPLPNLRQEIPGSVETALAKNVAALIPNRTRSTLQVGIGAALSDIGKAVQNKRLKIWSEMGSDWLIDTIATEKPAATEATVSFLHGSDLLYQVAADNPALKVDSSFVVNDPQTIAKQKRMVAVNTALQVDLSGNTNGEEIAGRVVSAPGGQPNFMEGAAMAPDGKAVLAIRSLNKYGQPTTVVALDGPTTTPSRHVDYVVTEWGATKRMRGFSEADRTYQILSVAHPFYRQSLAQAALQKKQITQTSYDKLVRSVYPALLRAEPGLRERLADSAFKGGLISEEQRVSIVASVPPGTVADFALVPEIARVEAAK